MTERQMQLRIGALVLVAIGLFMTFVLSIGQRSALFQERYSLWTSFSATEGLAVGAPVRLAGLTVGNVTRISFGRDPKDRRIAITLHDDSQAFAQLLNRWEGPIKRLCIRMLNDEHKAEDVTQEAF